MRRKTQNNNKVRQVMKTRVQAEKLGVGHVAQPGQRVPVAVYLGLHCPEHAVTGPACLDMAVLGDIIPIIVIDEVEIPHLSECHKRQTNQDKTDDNFRMTGKQFLHLVRFKIHW
jgi:hypothetical protein